MLLLLSVEKLLETSTLSDSPTDQLSHEKEKYKSLTEEMDQAFLELTGSN